MAWKKVVTRKDHLCHQCRKLIPTGSTCLSESRHDSIGNWMSLHRCPSLSCYFKPSERASLLAPPHQKQLKLSL